LFPSPTFNTYTIILKLLEFITLKISREQHKLCKATLCNFPHSAVTSSLWCLKTWHTYSVPWWEE
jgi:hypothetical protein